MILVGNQRGGSKDLALHLMKPENEHINVHEVRGFASDTVSGAFQEAYALSRGTQCRKFLYSLSVNPPPDKNITTDDFVATIERTESELSLSGQPRVIVFHEKQGRRHAHCVWSRIDADKMRAIHMPYDHQRLVNLSRDIFIERGWELPRGFINHKNRDPERYSLAEYQQAKRLGENPRLVKQDLQSAWAQSDSPAALKVALRERGYWLAKGDRRGFVVVNHHQKPYALAKWLGLKSKVVKDRLGLPENYPSTETTKSDIQATMDKTLSRLSKSVEKRAKEKQAKFDQRRTELVTKQRQERQSMVMKQAEQTKAANQQRQERFRGGLSGLWDKLRGEHKRIQQLNQREAYDQFKRHQQAKDQLIWQHMQQRQNIDRFQKRYQQKALDVQQRLALERRDLSHSR